MPLVQRVPRVSIAKRLCEQHQDGEVKSKRIFCERHQMICMKTVLVLYICMSSIPLRRTGHISAALQKKNGISAQ